MTLDVFDLVRNIYNASGGAAHPSVASALFGVLWREGWENGLAAAQAAANDRQDNYDEQNAAFDEAYRNTLGWSEAEWQEFWRSGRYRTTEEEALQFDQAWDTFDAFVAHLRRGGR
jgi:hypothetical protein